MSVITAWLTSKASGIALGAAIPMLFIFAGKFIPKKIGDMVAGLIGKQMTKIDEIQDPVLKGLYLSLALDIVRIVEYEIPDKGKSEEKYKAAADKLCAILPMLKGNESKVKELIESAVEAMDKELKNHIPGA